MIDVKVSRLSQIPPDEFASAVGQSETMTDLLGLLGYGYSSGTMGKYIRLRAEREGVAMTHIDAPLRQGDEKILQPGYSLDEILIEHSPYLNRNRLKIRLLREGLLVEECYDCGLPPVWNGRRLTLQLDHINGVNDDNRIENLRLLCPNCHSQTDTHSGKNKRGLGPGRKSIPKVRIRREFKCDCGAQIGPNARRCRKCFVETQYCTVWPEPGKLIVMVKRLGYVKVAQSLGVSDNAVRYRVLRHPPKSAE